MRELILHLGDEEVETLLSIGVQNILYNYIAINTEKPKKRKR